MKENKFKAGDKVRIYVANDTGEAYKSLGVVHGFSDKDGKMYVNEGGAMRTVWPQQCRKLVPKKKKPGDEIWLSPINFTISSCEQPNWIKYKRCK